MSRRTYELLEEPRGTTYRKLLSAALVRCDHVLLVVRKTIALGSSGTSLLDRLEQHLISRADQNEWPGTRLSDSTAQVLRYRLTPDSLTVLAEESEGLFAWCQPERPEDPCFMRADATPWLYTVSHEREAFLRIDQDEWSEVTTSIPELRLSLVRLH